MYECTRKEWLAVPACSPFWGRISERYMRRVESLDYLRGVMAVLVMVYHYKLWATGGVDELGLLARLGIYAVPIFYILSGLSLTLVYKDRLGTSLQIKAFFVKRIFRIFPLFWLVVTLFLLGSWGEGGSDGATIYKIFINYSLLFGFVDPTAYLSVGAWSIGNEMVFYFFFPVIVFFSSRVYGVFPIVVALGLLLGIFFSFFILDGSKNLATQWSWYVNPFNQAYFFLAGMAIGKWGRVYSLRKETGYFLVAMIALIFWLYPVASEDGGGLAALISGYERVVFSLLSIFFVWLVYVINPVFKSVLGRTLAFLGCGCYSIYLMHPIVAMYLVPELMEAGLYKTRAYVVAFFVTLLVGGLTFRFIEKPMMNVGKKVSGRLNAA